MPVYRNRWPNFCIICIHVRQVSVIWSIMFSAFSHSSWMMTQGKTIFVYSYLLVFLSLLTHNYDKFGSIVYGLFFKLPSPVCSSFSDILWTPSQPWRLVSSFPVGFSAEIVGPYVKNVVEGDKIVSEPVKALTDSSLLSDMALLFSIFLLDVFSVLSPLKWQWDTGNFLCGR